MKNTLILCILSALIAVGITYYIMKEQYPKTLEEFVGLPKNDPFDLNKDGILDSAKMANWFRSDSISLKDAHVMVQGFEDAVDFYIPTAWTFEADDIKKLVEKLDSSDYVKMYAGVKRDTAGDKLMTLIVLGNKGGKDITTKMFEYADPCPPKCGVCNDTLLSNKGCLLKWAGTIHDYRGDCKEYVKLNPQ